MLSSMISGIPPDARRHDGHPRRHRFGDNEPNVPRVVREGIYRKLETNDARPPDNREKRPVPDKHRRAL